MSTLTSLAHFIAALPAGAHVLCAHCGAGDDLLALQAAGFSVSACEPDLSLAKQASARAQLPVAVKPLTAMRTVVPFAGIWLSHGHVLPADYAALLRADGVVGQADVR
ncbi:MAG: hypothetical protein ACRCYV_11240 [Aeromonas sp.]